ncbi:acyl-CoA dehydrogenase family protein [Pseudonocardia humida]|uniref:Acyl-CoA dehydrogenase family protein n=1 Tax=Pseudonocardia humida TaxID=2800819 RepID=A0ABT0ZSU1_9PSEU|nr:acyl-CoA dehydrogenase family protein [Pseudonocardia humida]MCO1653759.1 acyl-CoA dehydrogenase family protein [Pseudonocardia humida]
MDFALPTELAQRLSELDAFIDSEIVPLQHQDDNERFFDHRREYARTDFENGGVPRREWEELLREMFRRADAAGWLRYGLPAEVGGSDGSNLDMAVIREHLAHRGLGLHNDLQNESSVVGNFPFVHMMLEYGTAEQKAQFLESMLTRTTRIGFGLTEPEHGSDATWMETTAVRDGGDWIIVHENRIRQAASGVGAGQYCIDRSVSYARERRTFGRPLATRQEIQWPLVELQTEAEMVRGLVRKTAWELDRVPHMQISDKVSMCNYRANRLVCEAADRAMQVHGGLGNTRHVPFEHIYRHHRRYRITEGAEEIQMRKVAGYLFGFAGPGKVRS